MSANASAAAELRRLHTGPTLLILPNAWDAGTARLIERAGASAIATTSAGVAWAHGYPDGNALPTPLLLATVSEIARVITVPLTVDIEAGYSDQPKDVETIVAAVIDAGGVGINLEDGDDAPDLLCAKIERARRAAASRGVELFINARTDVYLHALVPPERAVEETLARGARYRGAGADGLFVPGIVDRAEIQSVVTGAQLPVNVLARPGLPAADELRALGVRRLSAGSGVTQAVYGQTALLAAAFLETGRSETLAVEGTLAYPKMNAIFAAR